MAGPAASCLIVAGGWLAGVAWQLQQPVLGSVSSAGWMLAFSTLAVALFSVADKRWRRAWPALLLWVLAAAAAGHASTTLRAAARLADVLPGALEGQNLVVTGVVAELPRLGSTGTRFVLETESATQLGLAVRVPQRLYLGWYRSADDEAWLGGASEALRAGQRWRMTVRLRQPHGSLNPHGFDAELWLFEQRIGATGNVRAGAATPAVKLLENAGRPIERLRQSVRDAILHRVAEPAAAGVLAALAIGDQAAIERDGWELFRITGVAHLMSISGLHVTMFAWLAALGVGRLWRLHPRLLLACPAPLAARYSGLLAAAGYALLAGFSIPAQRTVAMIGVVVVLRSAGVRWPLHAALAAAALAVVAIDPWALLQAGFWLSFVAVALLMAAEPAVLARHAAVGWPARAWQGLRAGLRTQAVATVGLAPLTLVFFQQLSLVGFVANLVAIPMVTLLITPLALLGVVAPPLWLLAAWLVQVLTAVLQWLASFPLALWTAAAAPPWAVACGLLAGVLAVLPLPWRLRGLALPLLLPLLAPPLQRPHVGQFEMVAADIGQGTAVLVRTHAHLLLFDTGPAYSAESDAGGRVLLPLLLSRGENRIDLLLLSHRDSDHVGGAASVLAGVQVTQMSSSLTDGHPLLSTRPSTGPRSVPHRRCEAGQAWTWDGVHFEVLHPLAADHAQAAKSNALSCVLRVQGASISALLTGDIEAAQEAALLQRDREALRADVLLVPHHGSRTSSTAAFIDAVQPRVAVVQAAYRSRFGHPAPDVSARYAERAIVLLRSDRCGAWTLSAGSTASTAAAAAAAGCQRQIAQRYWHHRMGAEPVPITGP